MRKVLQLLSQPTHEDLDSMFSAGPERQVIANAQAIVEGRSPGSLYFVLQGLLGICAEALGDSNLREWTISCTTLP